MVSGSRVVDRPLHVGSAVALLLSLVGAFFAADFGHWWWHAGTIGAVWVISYSGIKSSKGQQRLFARIFTAITMTIVIAVGTVYLLANMSVVNLLELDQVTGGRNAVAAGVLINVASNMLLLSRRNVLVGLIGLITLVIVGNTSILALGVVALPGLYVAKKHGAKKQWKLFLSLYAVFVIVVGAVLPLINQAPQLSKVASLYGNDVTVVERLQAYRTAFTGFLESPFVGNGLGSFPTEYEAVYPEQRVLAHPHSALLQILFERGIIGLLSLVFLTAGVLAGRGRFPISLGLFGAVVLSVSLMDATFYHVLIFYSFWITLALLNNRAAEPDFASEGASDTTVVHTAPRRFQKQIFHRTQIVTDLAILSLGTVVVARFAAAFGNSPTAITWVAIISSLVSWGALRRTRFTLPGSYRSDFQLVFLPVISTVVMILIATITGVSIHLTTIGMYFIVTQTGFLFSRLVFRQMYPQVKVLLIGESKYEAELMNDPNLDVATTGEQYAMFDFIITGKESDTYAQRVAEARTAHRAVLTDREAIELFHGRLPPEEIPANWETVMRERNRRYLPWKRVIDTVVIVLLSPFILLALAVTALLVLISSGRPVIFSQLRVGKDNAPFRIYKFRTMKTDAEQSGAQFAQTSDERVTSIGRVLRGFRLDEVPQFLNVLRGEMSVIGPRPEQVDFVNEFEQTVPAYNLRHIVRPGITGWAQVNQGYAAGSEETRDKLTYDLFYISRLSIWMDLLVVIRTVVTILTKFGAK